MSFLLKIVEGPNKGAEIALVEGVAVTLGKGDDCDVILADNTLPDEPLKVEASADGVTVDGVALEQFAVKTAGATSFAVGPADAPWGALKWPKAAEEAASHGEAEAHGEETGESADEKNGERRSEAEDSGRGPETVREEKKRHGGCCGCVAALVVLLLILACLAWFFRAEVRPHVETAWERLSKQRTESHLPSILTASTLSDVASKYGLELVESNGVTRVSGNLRTRRERLAATAEAYQAKPGVELDISDDESFRAAAEDALFTLSEGALKVAAATNRFLSIVGSSPSPMSLKKMLEALNADLPKLRNVDVTGVVISSSAAANLERKDEGDHVSEFPGSGSSSPRRSRRSSASAAMPVCGILTTPYPCLVMRDGRRIMEGASIGDSVIVKIGADSIVLTNSIRRFVWKP